METKIVTHEVFLNATAHEVFEAYIDEKQHAEFTGAPANIERRAGGSFTLYGGHLSGTTREIEPNRRIEQAWRSANWPAGHFSQLTLSFSPIFEGRGTQPSLVQAGVPADQFESINSGWRTHYWTKMAEYLRAKEASAGAKTASQR
jgi:activator of HSP90 ATPase